MRKILQTSLILSIICTCCVNNISAQRNVGINVDDPRTILHLSSQTGVFCGLIFSNNATGNSFSNGLIMGLQYEANTTNKYGYIMVNEDAPLRFGTNGLDAMRITTSGNVSIGYHYAREKLEVRGNLLLSGDDRRMVFRNDADNGTLGSIGRFNNNVLSISNRNDSASSKFYYDVSNGKMGIGAIPEGIQGKLLISHNSGSTPHITLLETESTDFSRFEFANTGTSRSWHLAAKTAVGVGELNRKDDVFNVFNTSFGNIMTFRGDGRVGVHAITPANGYALSVNGDIVCEDLVIQNSNNWPDYVFESDYPLMPLKDLGIFIKANKHLPNIPNAATMEKDGLKVAEMQKLMMEKIEELSLYILQQQNQIEQQTKQINSLETRMIQHAQTKN